VIAFGLAFTGVNPAGPLFVFGAGIIAICALGTSAVNLNFLYVVGDAHRNIALDPDAPDREERFHVAKVGAVAGGLLLVEAVVVNVVMGWL
jgi:hypothetical protein